MRVRKNSPKRDFPYHYHGSPVQVSPANKEGRRKESKADPPKVREPYLTSGTAPITTTLNKATTRVDKIFERIFIEFGRLTILVPLSTRDFYTRHTHTYTHTYTDFGSALGEGGRGETGCLRSREACVTHTHSCPGRTLGSKPISPCGLSEAFEGSEISRIGKKKKRQAHNQYLPGHLTTLEIDFLKRGWLPTLF